jgi:restriction system protein
MILISSGFPLLTTAGLIVRQGDPTILLQAEIITLGTAHEHGAIVAAALLPWQEIYDAIQRDPEFLFRFANNPRKFEEFIAGAYKNARWDEVILTPRSGDGGRDVIAIRKGFGSVRFLEQTKAYRPGHLVTHDDVRAMLGVLLTDANSSKALITTTSDFQPGILQSDEFRRFMPHRLELRNGKQLSAWLQEQCSPTKTHTYQQKGPPCPCASNSARPGPGLR